MRLSLPGSGVSALVSHASPALPACRAGMGAPRCVTCHGAGTAAVVIVRRGQRRVRVIQGCHILI